MSANLRVSDYINSLLSDPIADENQGTNESIEYLISLYTSDSRSVSSPTSSSVVPLLTWNLLKKGIPLSNQAQRDESNAIRLRLQHLIRELAAAIESGDMAAHAMHIYKLITESHRRVEEHHAVLRRNYPGLKPQFYSTIHDHVVAIAAWRKKHTGSVTVDSPSRSSPTAPALSSPHFVPAGGFLPEISLSLPAEHLSQSSSQVPSAAAASEPEPATFQQQFNPLVDVGPVDETWLLRSCELYCANGGEAGLYMMPSEIATSIFRILKQDISNEKIIENMLGFLGIEAIEFAQAVLAKRLPILEVAFDVAPKQAGPRHGCQISIQTSEQKLLAKLRKKQPRHNNKAKGTPAPAAAPLTAAEIIAKLPTIKNPATRGDAKSQPHAPLISKDAVLFGIDTQPGLAAQLMLPAGAVRKVVSGKYEEVFVPATQHPDMPESERVPLTQFSALSQQVFATAKFTHLNRIQSAVFEAAYHSNENLLICAPTGAGKTNIALMTVLHEIEQHYTDGYLDLHSFKIIYIAPLKALAAEMVASFSEKLAPLKVVVRELTGDMQMTRQEIRDTQMIVTTPEKWDVITRKTSDDGLVASVRLLIIDEVHLINEDRGPVIETLVARTLRLVESSQSLIRLVGLSATLPNYRSVARFLHVNDRSIGSGGLFFFGQEYRPVPLEQTFIGIKSTDVATKANLLNDIAFERALKAIRGGKQAMVFVHSRNDTHKTAERFSMMAAEQGLASTFAADPRNPKVHARLKELNRSKNKQVALLAPLGFGTHHAGMLRTDRNLVEKLFMDNIIKVLVCTATLAWGVNLPAHTVIIKGTQLYDSKKSSFVELNMLDVTQIFGRAGRPQFDTSGEAIIITDFPQLPRYLGMLTSAIPIESQFIPHLSDNLNAEIVLGTVNNVSEAVIWLSYTYLYIRMRENPLAYGISPQEILQDPDLMNFRLRLINDSANLLEKARMIRYSRRTGTFGITDLGRIASHYYISRETIELLNENLKSNLAEPQLLGIIGQAHEFQQMRVREEEQPELCRIQDDYQLDIQGGPTYTFGKVALLLHAYILHTPIDAFSLVSDQGYVVENSKRIFRALFEMMLNRGWSSLAIQLLTWVRMLDRRLSPFQHPLIQFESLKREVIYKLESHELSLDKLVDMTATEIGNIARLSLPESKAVVQYVRRFPWLELEVKIRPITRTVLQIQLIISPQFQWHERSHGSALGWWIWVEDTETEEYIYHSEYFSLRRDHASEIQTLIFTIPLREPLPSQYVLHAVSDSWIGADTEVPISFQHLILPELHPPHTELLDLQPLPVTALGDSRFQSLYSFTHFNTVQTQFFHTLYHSDTNVLLGAPTGSGKTVAAELAVLRMLRESPPRSKAVYIAPLKALVRERMKDWKRKFVTKLGRTMVELTGDTVPDIQALLAADIVATTPEKWDGVTRNWHDRDYIKNVAVIIIDEIHLLGGDRGPILEIIVSRMRYISSQTDRRIRIVGLSTALANAHDLSEWLGIARNGLFNFRPVVRPVPIEPHIAAFSGKHYCPRMQTMNKPAYNAILTHSPTKPVLIFVSSRRQTRLTAADLISLVATDPLSHPRKFLHIDDQLLTAILKDIKDASLRNTLAFGIGLHHAGLPRSDKKIVERLFGDGHIQVLISTSTLAWGVNLPAHLVIIKGTEFFDAKSHRYVDMPITDIMQMMGRAGRPQFDQSAVACLFVQQEKRNFYKKFLFEPFPVESSLAEVLHDHLNAEVVGGTIKQTQDAVDFLTWTFWFRRILVNPSYYHLEDTSPATINKHLTNLVNETFADLEKAQCLKVYPQGFVEEETGAVFPPGSIQPLTLGYIASYYYLKYTTMSLFARRIKADCDLNAVLRILSDTSEYDELPVRHNEELLNEELNKGTPYPFPATANFEDPHIKAHLLLQCHFSNLPLPISDYTTDLRSVLDQSIRILQAMIDVAADQGWFVTARHAMHLVQMIHQTCWRDIDAVLAKALNLSKTAVEQLNASQVTLVALVNRSVADQTQVLTPLIPQADRRQRALEVLGRYPAISLTEHVEVNLHGELILKLHLKRENNSSPHQVTAPGFLKSVKEQWWLVVTFPNDELAALKRVQLAKQTTQTITIPSPPVDQHGRSLLTIHLISGNYIGIDQEWPLNLSLKNLPRAKIAPPQVIESKPLDQFWE